MDLVSARKLARSLMDQHGLTGWRFAYDRARRRFGSCIWTTRTITLSAHLVRLNQPEEVRDTILHEIAHALTPGDNHGERWKAACRRIGANPQRCFREGQGVRTVQGGLRIGCCNCDCWANRHRITWALQVCRKCRRQVIWEHIRSGQRYRIERRANGFQAVSVAVA